MKLRNGLAAAWLAISLLGCASGATVAGMTVTPDLLPTKQNPALKSALGVQDVAGGQDTNPAWTSQVGNAEFKAALVDSLRLAGLLAEGPGAPRCTLVATLLKLDQPFIGLDMTVTAAVEYALVDAKTGAALWKQKVETPHTATMGDAFVGSKRLQLANEGSIKKNIAKLIEALAAANLAGPIAVN